MSITTFDSFERVGLSHISFDVPERMREMNKEFPSKVTPEKGIYGLQEIDKGNGVLERRYRDVDSNITKDYYQDGRLTKTRQKMGEKTWVLTRYDDAGTAYSREVSTRGKNTVISHTIELTPNIEIKKGNYTAVTDSYGRPVSARITDLQISPGRENLSSKLRDNAYRKADHRGHIIADIFGGPSGKENIIPQHGEINQTDMRRLEGEIRRLKEAGNRVDYEMKVNYTGKSRRPTSLEPKITVNGKPYELTGDLADLKKIYNSKHKTLTNMKEGVDKSLKKNITRNEVGINQGIGAATITAAVSTVDNVYQYANGDITAEEMAKNIAVDTGKAGIVGYGAGFITEGIASGMKASSKQLIRSLSGAGVPAAMVSFGIETYDSVSAFAQGKIDGTELAYDLGDGAASVAGSMIGAQYGAAIGTAIMPGVGTVAGGLVGGMVGCAVTSEAYKSAVECGSDGADYLGDKAKDIAEDTIKLAEENVPENVESIKTAINNFSAENNLPFNF